LAALLTLQVKDRYGSFFVTDLSLIAMLYVSAESRQEMWELQIILSIRKIIKHCSL